MFFILTSFLPTYSQEPAFVQFTSEDGLPSNTIYEIKQDHHGYLWLATNNGVSRYNGNKFKNDFVYKDKTYNTDITNIFNDPKGTVWFININCKLSYYSNDTIYPYKYNDNLAQSLEQDGPYTIKNSQFFDEYDTLFISLGHNGIRKVAPSGKVFKIKEEANTFGLHKTGDLLLLSLQTPIHVEKDGIRVGLYGNKKVLRHKIPFENKMRQNALMYNDIAYFSINNKLYRYHENPILLKELPSNIIWLSNDTEGGIWCGLINEGVYRVTPNKIDLKDKCLLKGKSVSSVFQDKKGGFWFTTLNDGLFYCSNINVLNFGNETFNNLHNSCLLKTKKNNLLIGTEEGTIIDFDLKKPTYCKIPKGKNGHIHKISTHDNDYYISSRNGSYKFENKNFENKINMPNPSPIFPTIQSTSHFVKDDKIYLGTHNGHYIMDKNSFSITPSFSANINIRDLAVLNDSTLLLGSFFGLIKTTKNDTIQLKKYHPSLGYPISKIEYNAKRNHTWVAANSGGLVLLHQDTVNVIDQSNGLNFNQVSKFTILNDSTIFAASINGGLAKIIINSFQPFKATVSNINKTGLLLSDNVKDLMANNDTLWMVTAKTLSVIPLKTLNTKDSSFPIYYEHFFVNKIPIPINGEKIFPASQNNVKITYAALNFGNNKTLQYRFKTKQNQKDWTYTNHTELDLVDLAPGNYQVHIEAKDINNQWIKPQEILTFTILSPWYKTWWAYSAYWGLSVGIIAIIFLVRGKQLNEKNKLLEATNRSKYEALSAQMNPHFIFNALGAIENFMLKDDRQNYNLYIGKFSRLIRMILHNSREQYVTLADETSALQLYLEIEALRFKNKLSFSISKAGNIESELIKIPPMLVQPFVENALIHGILPKEKGGDLNIHFFKENNKLIVEIQDSGIGRKASSELNKNRKREHKSLGMKITKSRLDSVASIYKIETKLEVMDLVDQNDVILGTKVLISLPLIKIVV